jgi:hypothetical protein
MDLSLTTPGLLFPAISLLLLAYTSRFLALATVIRKLHADHKIEPNPRHLAQIESLRYRLKLIKYMQELGVGAFLCCVVSMTALFYGWKQEGEWLFGLSLMLFSISLMLSIAEIRRSTAALEIALSDLEK